MRPLAPMNLWRDSAAHEKGDEPDPERGAEPSRARCKEAECGCRVVTVGSLPKPHRAGGAQRWSGAPGRTTFISLFLSGTQGKICIESVTAFRVRATVRLFFFLLSQSNTKS